MVRGLVRRIQGHHVDDVRPVDDRLLELGLERRPLRPVGQDVVDRPDEPATGRREPVERREEGRQAPCCASSSVSAVSRTLFVQCRWRTTWAPALVSAATSCSSRQVVQRDRGDAGIEGMTVQQGLVRVERRDRVVVEDHRVVDAEALEEPGRGSALGHDLAGIAGGPQDRAGHAIRLARQRASTSA